MCLLYGRLGGGRREGRRRGERAWGRLGRREVPLSCLLSGLWEEEEGCTAYHGRACYGREEEHGGEEAASLYGIILYNRYGAVP